MANLFNKAGLVNIPSGYKDGKLENIKPIDPTLGFRFNRDSGATRVNKEGLIEQVGYFGPELVQNGNFSELGPELVTNGDFATDSDWNKTNATISNGKAIISVPNGAYSTIAQGISYTSGKIYKLFVQVKGLNGSSGKEIRIQDNSSNAGGLGLQNARITLDETLQTLEVYWTANSSSNVITVSRNSSADYSFEVHNISVKQVDPNDYWTVANNTGSDTIIKDGYAVIKTDGVFTQIAQSNILSIGKTYKLVYDVIESDNGNLGLEIGGSTTLIPSTVGTHTFIWTSNSNNLPIKRYSGALDISITNISVTEVLGDKPRIDYTDSLTSPSFLLEPQSTNLITYSEDFSQSVWTKTNLSILSDSIISPEGILSAGKLIPDTTSGQHKIDITRTVADGATVSLSAFVKKGEYNFCCLYEVTSSTGRFFDLSNGTQGGTFVGAPTTSNIENYNNDWYRISISTTVPSTSARYILYVCDTISNTSFVGDNTKGIYAWGAQLEQESYPTSYIPTAGSTVTRAQETCIGAGNVSTFNSTEGVLYAEMASLADDGTTRYVSVSDGGNQNAIAIRFSDVNNQILAYTRIGGVYNAVLLTSSYSTVNFNKIAYRYKSGDSTLFINGTKISSSTSTQTLPANTLNALGFNDGLYAPMEGKVKGVYVFNEALTDDELQQLTGPEYNSFAALAAAYNYTVI